MPSLAEFRSAALTPPLQVRSTAQPSPQLVAPRPSAPQSAPTQPKPVFRPIRPASRFTEVTTIWRDGRVERNRVYEPDAHGVSTEEVVRVLDAGGPQSAGYIGPVFPQ